MKQIKVTFDGCNYFNAFTNGETWNGFECPYFTESEGKKIVDHLQEGLTFSNEMQLFIEYDLCDVENTESYTTYKGTPTEHGLLYAIGSNGWAWEQ